MDKKKLAPQETIAGITWHEGTYRGDMPLRHFRRQYEQLSQFERGRIINMMEAGWSARQVARQLGHSDCVVRRCCDQWIREMSLTRIPGSGHHRQTNLLKVLHIVRKCMSIANCFIGRHPGTGRPSLGTPVSSRTTRRRLADEHLGSWRPLPVLSLTPTHRCLRLECCSEREN
ncbi:transposable element Tcb2 transposase [Trichonephila clavipes]|nr:transposable element Tcb2 transposase [Trichonephila clavipes]